VSSGVKPFIKQVLMDKIDAAIKSILIAVQVAPDSLPGVPFALPSANVQTNALTKYSTDPAEVYTVGAFTVPALEGMRRRTLLTHPDSAGDLVISGAWSYHPHTGVGKAAQPNQVEFNPRAYVDYPTAIGGTCEGAACEACRMFEDVNVYNDGCTEAFSYVSKLTVDKVSGSPHTVDSATISISYGEEPIEIMLTLRYDLAGISGALPVCKRFTNGVWDDSTVTTSQGVIDKTASGVGQYGKVKCMATLAGEYAVFPYVPPPPTPPPPSPPSPPPSPATPSTPGVPAEPAPSPSPPPAAKKEEVPVGAIAGGVAAGVVAVLGCALAFFLYRRRKYRTPVQTIEDRPLVGDDGMQPRKGQPSGAVRTQAMLETE